MGLPVYQHITVKSTSFEELAELLSKELNLRHPVSINLKSLDMDQQREIIGLVENHFVTNGMSYKFPYPVYVVTDHEPAISGLPLINDPKGLPKYFAQREGKLNVKETHLLSKNKLLQQEVLNGDSSVTEASLRAFGRAHREIYLLEEERLLYKDILQRLEKAEKNGQ